MIAYNKTWLRNREIHSDLKDLEEEEIISREEREGIEKVYPVGFYTPHFFIALGLFLLTVLIVIAGAALFVLFFIPGSHYREYGLAGIFLGILAYIALEWFVRKRHYRSGVDEALIWTSGLMVIGGLNIYQDITPLLNAELILLFSLYIMIRFVHPVMALVSLLSLMGVFLFGMENLGSPAVKAIPFVWMIAAGAIYLFAHAGITRKKFPYHIHCLLFLEIASLVCFYLAGNYYVVREGNIFWFHIQLKPGEGIGTDWLFWIFTTTIPFLCLASGIQKKDAIRIRVGLILLAAMAFTIHHYYSIMSMEAAMMGSGILLIVTASILIRWLKVPKYGFTSREKSFSGQTGKIIWDSLLVMQIQGQVPAPPNSGEQFGGGSGGGGGAGGSF